MTRRMRAAPDLPSLMSNPGVLESSMASVQGQGKWVEPCGTKRNAAFGKPVCHDHRFSKCSATSLLLSYPPWVLIQKAAEVVFILLSHYDAFFSRIPNTSLFIDWTDVLSKSAL